LILIKKLFSSFRAGEALWTSSPGCARGYSHVALSEPTLPTQGRLFIRIEIIQLEKRRGDFCTNVQAEHFSRISVTAIKINLIETWLLL
jgi:hypothetical protein